MILALILTCAATLSSAQPAPSADSLVPSPTSLVPYSESASPSLVIPKPNYTGPHTTSRNWDGVVSEPTPKERAPGLVSRSLYSAALVATGVLLTGTGIAYWQHWQEANAVANQAGVNPLGLMVVATISIPVGAALAVLGGLSLLSIPASSDDLDRD